MRSEGNVLAPRRDGQPSAAALNKGPALGPSLPDEGRKILGMVRIQGVTLSTART
jgi:hypothetical protein